MGKLDGKVALITGAARGQGRVESVLFASEGADVIAIDIASPVSTVEYPGATPEDLKETCRLVEAEGRHIAAMETDVRDHDAMGAAVADGVRRFGRLDVVVANAGILSPPKLSWEYSEEEWRTTIDVNLTGVWHTTKAAIPHLLSTGDGGSIIGIASIAGLKGAPNVSNYVAAKHGLIGLTRSLANELAEHRIRVNTICPTNVRTPMIDNPVSARIFRPDLDAPTLGDSVEVLTGLNLMPLPYVESHDIAAAALWLASDDSRYVTGVALPVDAGMTQKWD